MMTYYSNITEAFEDAIKCAIHEGKHLDSRNGGSFELLGTSFKIMNPAQLFVTNEVRAMSPSYAAGELLWYLKGSNDGEMISYYAPSYQNYLVGGIAPGAYGPKLATGLPTVIKELRTSPNSRRAFLPIFEAADFDPASPDVPCTTGLQFLVRDGYLHCIVNMRSNDIWLGLPYDFFCFASIMQYVAWELSLKVGTYTHNVGSLHLYSRHLEKAIQAIGCDSKPYYTPEGENSLLWDFGDFINNPGEVYRQEEECRALRSAMRFGEQQGLVRDDFATTIIELATARSSQYHGMGMPPPTNCPIATMAVDTYNEKGH